MSGPFVHETPFKLRVSKRGDRPRVTSGLPWIGECLGQSSSISWSDGRVGARMPKQLGVNCKASAMPL